MQVKIFCDFSFVKSGTIRNKIQQAGTSQKQFQTASETKKPPFLWAISDIDRHSVVFNSI